MAAVAALDVKPDMAVLDVCGAPGGKGSMAAGRTKGLVVMNDPIRPGLITQTVERLGLPNVLVTQAKPEQLAAYWPHAFPRVLVDAPCSGEGMFRKDEGAKREWQPQSPARCAVRQRGILEAAYQCLQPGGRLVYSTCTFSQEENEDVIQAFLKAHPDWRLIPAFPDEAYTQWGFQRTLTHAARLWPHRTVGEGHFIAVLTWDGEGVYRQPERQYSPPPELLQAWAREYMLQLPEGVWECRKNRWYLTPICTGSALRTQPVQMGTLLTSRGKWVQRWEPAHGLAMMQGAQFSNKLCLQADDVQVTDYMQGLPLSPVFAGWGVVNVEWPLGWVKGSDTLKNHLPSGLRWT